MSLCREGVVDRWTGMNRRYRADRAVVQAEERSEPRSIPDPKLHDCENVPPAIDASLSSPPAPDIWSLGHRGGRLRGTGAAPRLPHAVIRTAHSSPNAG